MPDELLLAAVGTAATTALDYELAMHLNKSTGLHCPAPDLELLNPRYINTSKAGQTPKGGSAAEFAAFWCARFLLPRVRKA